MFAPLSVLTLGGTGAVVPNPPPGASVRIPLTNWVGIDSNVSSLNSDPAAQTAYLTALQAAIPSNIFRLLRDGSYAVPAITGVYPNWNQNNAGYYKLTYQRSAPADFMTSYSEDGVIVTPPPTIQVPPAAAAAGLQNLFFSDEFDTISFYHPTNTGQVGAVHYSPSGTWRHGDQWSDPLHPGYIDFGATKSININPLIMFSDYAPLQPLSLSAPSVLRLTCRRVNLASNPPYRAHINAQAVSQGQPVDSTLWAAAWIGMNRFGSDSSRYVRRPAYLESRLRMLNVTAGIGGAFWMYVTGDPTNVHTPNQIDVAQEIDIFDISGDPTAWYTHIHGTGHEGEYNSGQQFNDGLFHTWGCHWGTTFIRIYRDDVLMRQWTTSPDTTWFSDSMNVIFSFAGDVYFPVSSSISEMYFDVDWVRVWR